MPLNTLETQCKIFWAYFALVGNIGSTYLIYLANTWMNVILEENAICIGTIVCK